MKKKNIVYLYTIEVEQGLYNEENWGKEDFQKSQGKSENFFCGLQKYVFPSLSQAIFKILKQLLSFLYILHLLLHDTLDRALLRS